MIRNIYSPVKATIFHKLPTSLSSNDPILIFIPGNPGFIQYYDTYLSSIASTTNWEVLGISHLGFQDGDEDNNRIYTLQEQINHKISVINEFVKNDRDVFIFGHSVGSWILQRILDDTCTKINYKFIGFITPTILDIHKSKNGIVLHSIINQIPSFYKIIGNLSNLVYFTPNYVLDKLISFQISSDIDDAKELTKRFITNPNFVKQSLGLATEEMLTIQSDWSYHEEFLQQFNQIPKWWFFTNPDGWVSDSTQQDIIKSVKSHDENSSITRDDTINHSFCINQSEQFVKLTLQALKNFI